MKLEALCLLLEASSKKWEVTGVSRAYREGRKVGWRNIVHELERRTAASLEALFWRNRET